MTRQYYCKLSNNRITIAIIGFIATIALAECSPYKAIELAKREKTAISAVADKNSTIDETAFWMLCGKIAENSSALPQQNETEFAIYHDLVNQPESFRAKAVNLRVSVFTLEKLTAGITPGWPKRKYWLKGSNFWRMSCLIDNDNTPQTDKPLIIYSLLEPTELLAQKAVKSKDNPDQKLYPQGVKLILTGVFYKSAQLADIATGKKRDYPIILAYYIKPLVPPIKVFPEKNFLFIILTIIFLMASGFYLTKKLTRKTAKEKTTTAYEPLESKETQTNQSIDQKLVEAVKDFQNQH